MLNSLVEKNGGGGWIRTIEGVASRFTVCPLWPLGNPTKPKLGSTIINPIYE